MSEALAGFVGDDRLARLSQVRESGLTRREVCSDRHPERVGSEQRRQRSFNRQSTAFVMRGLWVRLPPLAFAESLLRW